MSHNLPPPSSLSSPQLTSSTAASSAATLASLLTAALADVERLKQEVDASTKRAVCAENLLRSLVVEDPSPTTTSNTASTTTTAPTTTAANTTTTTAAASSNSGNTAIESKNGAVTSQSLTPAALTALMSAESRAAAAEARLAAFLDSWSELLRLEDRAADERRRLEDRIIDERRRVVMSFEREGSSSAGAAFGRRSPPTYPLLRTESAPLAYSSSSSSSSSRLGPLRPTTSFSSYSQHVPSYTFQINGVNSSAIIPLSSTHAPHSRIRPRTTSDASQPPSKRLRAGSASSTQIQQHPGSSYYPQSIHTSPSTRISPYPYQPQPQLQSHHTSRSQHLHPSQNTHPSQQPSKSRISHSPANVGSTASRHASQQPQSQPQQHPEQQQQQQAQKGHGTSSNRHPEPVDHDDESNDVAALEASPDENRRGGGGGDTAHGAVSRSGKSRASARKSASSTNRYRGDGHPHLHHTGARDREVSDLDNELVGIIDDATSHPSHHHPHSHHPPHHHHYPHHPQHHRGQTEHDDEIEQEDPSAMLVDELLDAPSHRSNLNRPPDFEVLQQDEEVDAEGEEDELSNASIDDLLLEVAGGAGAAGVPGGVNTAGGGGGGGSSRERSDPGVGSNNAITAIGTGEKAAAVKTRSGANAKGFVSVARLTQSQSQSQLASPSQPQTARPKQPLKQHLSTSSALGDINSSTTTTGGGGTGSHSPVPPPQVPPSAGGSSGGLTSSSSLPGLGPTLSLSSSHLFKAAGLPPGGYPAFNTQGERLCRQCGQPGRYKDGKCVEKWGPGPEGPGTVCDRCRKKMKRVERRGDANATMLAQAQAQARAEAQHIQAQAQAQAASAHSQNGTLSAQTSLASVTGRGEKNNAKSTTANSRSPHVSPRNEKEKEREREKDKVKEEGVSAGQAVGGGGGGGGSNNGNNGGGGGGGGGGNGSPTDASTDMSTDEFKSIV